jgi:hypothetical protein
MVRRGRRRRQFSSASASSEAHEKRHPGGAREARRGSLQAMLGVEPKDLSSQPGQIRPVPENVAPTAHLTFSARGERSIRTQSAQGNFGSNSSAFARARRCSGVSAVTCSAVSVRVSPSSSGCIPGPKSEAVLNPDACVGCSGRRNGNALRRGRPDQSGVRFRRTRHGPYSTQSGCSRLARQPSSRDACLRKLPSFAGSRVCTRSIMIKSPSPELRRLVDEPLSELPPRPAGFGRSSPAQWRSSRTLACSRLPTTPRSVSAWSSASPSSATSSEDA